MAQLVPAETFDLVIFGGTGDLAMRKLLPALYHRDLDGQLTPDSRIVAASRGELSSEDYRGLVEEALRRNLAEGEFDESFWQTFANRIHYVQTTGRRSCSYLIALRIACASLTWPRPRVCSAPLRKV
jgi:glucose-6-phosphate 1-dehydrogenase